VNKSAVLRGLSVLALAAAAQPAWAQPADAGAAASADTGMGDIVVTARRREESAQTVPVSVTALSTRALEERSVRTLGDLTAVVPGIRFSHYGGGGNMNITLRGLNRIPLGTAPNAVINYFADVPLNFQGSNLPTYDLGSLQVFKGPQGTLFGRNAIGGAVILTPQAPTYEVEGYYKGSLGNYDYRDVEGAINIPLAPEVAALRLACPSSEHSAQLAA